MKIKSRFFAITLGALVGFAAAGAAVLYVQALEDRRNANAPKRATLEVDSALAQKLMEKTRAARLFLAEGDAKRGEAQGLLPAGTQSVLNISKTMKYGDFEWDTDGVPDGELLIRVDVRRQLVSVYRAGHEIGTAVALYGMDGKETPLGRFPILSKVEDYRSRTYDAPMPYTMWMTNDGVALHASSVTEGRATNGCVGIPLGFARQVYAAAKPGDIIEVVRSPVPNGASLS